MRIQRYALLGMIAAVTWLAPLTYAQGPVFKVTPLTSTIKFNVSASVPIAGNFDKWTATLKFPSADVTTGQLDIQISAATVNTGSGMKNDKLKSKDFFDVTQNPYITFKSTKVVQTGPTTFDVTGDFTIRGVSKPETLKVDISGKGTGHGTIKGTMAFDRKDYGMNSGIPFIKIADRVEVDIDLTADQVSGPKIKYKE
jgi:polyisoprenoid-binding protein YceI